ncbi:MAG TPA: MATE family efflux transporter [Solirubrobacteraceae bacterium]|jgi:O-antigen/teichoic acid export membrane protein|nr:MATE family efflux transporter [Solirubrobacteraceae bacterium]
MPGPSLSKRPRRALRRARAGEWRAGAIPVNTTLAAGRTVIRGIIAFAMLPLLIHRIGSAATGLFIVATTLTGYFNSVEYGLGIGVTKYVAEHRAAGDAEQLGSVLRAALVLMLGIGVLVATALALLAVLGGSALFGTTATGKEAVPTLLVAAVTALFYWPSRLGTAALEGLERYDLNAIVQACSAMVTFALIYAATERTHSVALLTGIFCAMLVFEGLCAGALAWPHLGLRRGVGNWRGAHLRPALGFSAGLFLMGLADTSIYESDRIVVAAFVGAAAVVAYEVALRPHSGLRLIHGLIGGALVSTCSRLVAQDRFERLRRLVLVGSLYGIVLTLPFVVLTLVLARPILEAWIGSGYGRYAAYVQIFASYWLINASGAPVGGAIIGIGRIRIFVWLTTIGAVLTLGLSIGLTAALGTIGVILGTVIPAWLGFPLTMHYSLRQIGISKVCFAREVLIPGYLPIAVWTIPVLAGDWVLRPSGLLGLSVFCAISLGLLWLALLPMLRARWRSIGSID